MKHPTSLLWLTVVLTAGCAEGQAGREEASDDLSATDESTSADGDDGLDTGDGSTTEGVPGDGDGDTGDGDDTTTDTGPMGCIPAFFNQTNFDESCFQ